MHALYSFPSHRRYYSIMLACILLLGLALKVPYLAAHMYNPDEGWQILAASAPDWRSVWQRNYADITHPPFTVLLMHFLLQLHDAIWVPRLAGVIANMLLAFAGYHLGKAATQNKTVGLLLAIAFTFSPPFDLLALVVRGYIYMLLFLVAGLVFYFRFARKERTKDLALYALCMALALFTEYCAVAVVFACGCIQGIALWRKHDLLHRHTLWWGLIHAALAGWFLLGYLQHPFTSGQVTWLNDYYFPSHALIATVIVLLVYPFFQFSLAGCIASICAAATAVLSFKKPWNTFFVFHVGGALLLLIAMATIADVIKLYPLNYGRHTAYMAPFFLLAISYGVVKYPKWRADYLPWLPVAALCICAVSSNVAKFGQFMLPLSEIPILSDTLRRLPKGSVVFMDTQAHFMLFKSGIVDSVSTDPHSVVLHIGNTSLVKINQPPIRLKSPDGSVNGNFFVTVEDFVKLQQIAPEQTTLYLIEMGFKHGALTTQCDKEAKAYLHPVYHTAYVQLYRFTRSEGGMLAQQCSTHLSSRQNRIIW